MILYQIFNQILKRPISKGEISWLMRVSSPDPVHLTVDNQQVPTGHEFGDYEGQVGTVLPADGEMESGDRQVTVGLRSLPKVM